MSDIILSCHNLIETNNGMFKSDAQKKFFFDVSFEGMIVHSGQTFKTKWKEFFILDDSGIVEYQRESNIKGLVTLWKRGEVTKKQARAVKFKKSVDEFEIIERELNALFNDKCIAKYGYILDVKQVYSMFDAIQKASNLTNILKQYPTSEWSDVVITFASNLDSLKEWESMIRDTLDFITDFRVMVLENYNLKFQLRFLESY